MRPIHYLLAVAVMSAGAATWAADNTSEDTQLEDQSGMKSRSDQAAGANLPQGIEYKDLHESSDIRNSLAKLTNVALKKNDFGSFTKYFVDFDRDRFKQEDKNSNLTKQDNDPLNGQIDQFRQAWKNKYGSDFDATDDAKNIYTDQFVKVFQGEISDSHLLAQHWPVPATADMAQNMRQASMNTNNAKDDQSDRFMGGEKKLDKGRNVAVVILPASHGLPEVTLSLIHELPDSWVLDVPDNVTQADLHRNLSAQLTSILASQAQWPADKGEAQRMILHRIAMAAYNVPTNMGNPMVTDQP